MIRFKTRTTLQVVENFDKETEVTDESEDTFEQGEQADADIFNEEEDLADIQFGDGSVAFRVPKDSFEVID